MHLSSGREPLGRTCWVAALARSSFCASRISSMGDRPVMCARSACRAMKADCVAVAVAVRDAALSRACGPTSGGRAVLGVGAPLLRRNSAPDGGPTRHWLRAAASGLPPPPAAAASRAVGDGMRALELLRLAAPSAIVIDGLSMTPVVSRRPLQFGPCTKRYFWQ